MIKIGKKEFEDSDEFVEYCCDIIDKYVDDISENKEWGTVQLSDEEAFEDWQGNIHYEIISCRLDQFIERSVNRFYRIGCYHFGIDEMFLSEEIRCTFLMRE